SWLTSARAWHRWSISISSIGTFRVIRSLMSGPSSGLRPDPGRANAAGSFAARRMTGSVNVRCYDRSRRGAMRLADRDVDLRRVPLDQRHRGDGQLDPRPITVDAAEHGERIDLRVVGPDRPVERVRQRLDLVVEIAPSRVGLIDDGLDGVAHVQRPAARPGSREHGPHVALVGPLRLGRELAALVARGALPGHAAAL